MSSFIEINDNIKRKLQSRSLKSGISEEDIVNDVLADYLKDEEIQTDDGLSLEEIERIFTEDDEDMVPPIEMYQLSDEELDQLKKEFERNPKKDFSLLCGLIK